MKRSREEADGAVAAGTGTSQAASSSGVITGPEIARSRGGAPIEAEKRAVKRNAEEEAERDEVKVEHESRERGVKRGLGDWEDYAKILRCKSEQKATEAEQAGAGMDVGRLENRVYWGSWMGLRTTRHQERRWTRS